MNFEYQIQLLKRIRELSSVTYLEMLSWDKTKGIEIEKVSMKKEISPKFFERNSLRNFNDGKYAIFRLYTNNNPIGGKLYRH